MDVREAIYSRRAVRDFQSIAVDEAQLLDLIDQAVQAPSAMDEQPWLFSVVQGSELLTKISTQSKEFMLRRSRNGMLPANLKPMLEDENFNIFYNAPTLIVISSQGGHWAVEECALAAENLMLAALGQGLGTCWIGLAQDWLSTSEGRTALKLTESATPVAPIIIGHPHNVPPLKVKRPARITWVA